MCFVSKKTIQKQKKEKLKIDQGIRKQLVSRDTGIGWDGSGESVVTTKD